MTENIRTKYEIEKRKQNQLFVEIQSLQKQLADAKNGLFAAARISDQLELSQMSVNNLKNECKYTICFYYFECMRI